MTTKLSAKMYPYASFCTDPNCCDFMGRICTECGEHIKIKSKKDNSVSKHYDSKHPETITEWVVA
jgi:hypothetical protein